MTGPRIAFDRTRPSCTACGTDLPSDAVDSLRLALVDPAVDVALCPPCRARIEQDGIAPPALVPAFAFQGKLRVPVATADDLGALLDAIVRAGPPPSATLAPHVARARTPTIADHDALVEHVLRGDARPTPVELAATLVSSAVLGIEPEPAETLRTRVDRAGGGDELLACFGAYCARISAVQELGIALPVRAQRLLELADRSLLFATPPTGHPLGVRVAQIRAAIALVLDRGSTVDAILPKVGRDDPRSQLLRGLRFAQQSHLAAADREFRAAVENPFAGFDPEVDGAAIWNRTMRALDGSRFEEARVALRSYCRLLPNDRTARLVLAHAYLAEARSPVAREVLASVLDATATSHLHALAHDDDLDPELHLEGVLLYAACLQRLGDVAGARRVLEDALRSDVVAGRARRAELLRLAAQCALAEGDAESALERLAIAWPLDASPVTAHEIAHAALAAARACLATDGLHGFAALLARHAWLPAALRKRYGAAHALMLATFIGQQVRGGFRKEAGFGLDWGWLGARGANAVTATFQAYASLARHQVPNALQHALAAENGGGAAVPFAFLSALFVAVRAAAPADVAWLVHVVATVAQTALRDLDAGR